MTRAPIIYSRAKNPFLRDRKKPELEIVSDHGDVGHVGHAFTQKKKRGIRFRWLLLLLLLLLMTDASELEFRGKSYKKKMGLGSFGATWGLLTDRRGNPYVETDDLAYIRNSIEKKTSSLDWFRDIVRRSRRTMSLSSRIYGTA